MSSKTSFYWHDYETSGSDTRRDRPLQFAGVRTDAELNLIGEPLILYCKPAEDLLPHPKACLITGITPQLALDQGVSEPEFIGRVLQELAQPHTCGVGYNSIRFDDEITRHCLYRNFYDPYAREWQNGCSRWDIIDMLRLARALRPEGINWPVYESGEPSLRLEDLTAANGIDHGQAHDALSDVLATIEIARLVKQAQPRLYEYVVTHRSKQQVQSMLDTVTMKPVLHVSSKYPSARGNLALIAPLALHPTNGNARIVWDLNQDPQALFDLEPEAIRTYLYTPRSQRDPEIELPLKLVHINRAPILAPAAMLRPEEAERLGIDGERCRSNLAQLRNAPGLADKLNRIFSEDSVQESDPDLMLYSGGFFSNTDRQLMERVVAASEEQLAGLHPPFQDGRLEEMLLRYKGRNYPESLSDDERQLWEEYRAERLLRGSGGFLTIPRLFDEINALASGSDLSARDVEILEELALYAESIYPVELDS